MADVGRWEQVEIIWLDKTNTPDAIATMLCPVCELYSSQVYFYGNPTDGMNYCPRCGNHMKQKPTSDPKSTFYDLLYEEGGANTT